MIYIDSYRLCLLADIRDIYIYIVIEEKKKFFLIHEIYLNYYLYTYNF